VTPFRIRNPTDKLGEDVSTRGAQDLKSPLQRLQYINSPTRVLSMTRKPRRGRQPAIGSCFSATLGCMGNSKGLPPIRIHTSSMYAYVCVEQYDHDHERPKNATKGARGCGCPLS